MEKEKLDEMENKLENIQRKLRTIAENELREINEELGHLRGDLAALINTL